MAIMHITKANFEQEVVNAQQLVLLDFWASWCGPCRMIAPFIDEIADENETVLVGKVNVDEEMELASQFGITSIPTLVVLKGGKVVTTALGYRPKADIMKLLEVE